LSGSSFNYSLQDPASGHSLNLWGRGMYSSFDGREDDVSLDGDLATGLMGMDYAADNWQAGVALLYTLGDGEYAGDGGKGRLDSDMLSFVPYAAYQTARTDFWGAFGRGRGSLELSQARAPDTVLETDMRWLMAAGGFSSRLTSLFGDGGPSLSLVGDAQWTKTTSDKTDGLGSASAQTTLVSLGLESGWTWTRDEHSLRPEIDARVRYDAGDADTGLGMEMGAGLHWTQARWGLSADIEGRMMVAHQAAGFNRHSLSAALSYNPDLSRLGPSLRLAHDIGGLAGGGMSGVFADNLPGSGAGGAGQGKWTFDAGYGAPVFRHRFIWSPTIGATFDNRASDYRVGWALEPARADYRIEFTAAHRDHIDADDYGAEIRITSQWE